MAGELLNWQEGINETIDVRVTAKASNNRIKAEALPDGSLLIRVYVTVVAEGARLMKPS